MRAGALACSNGVSMPVNRNGPSTFVANVNSIPSGERIRSGGSTPALFTSTSRRGSRELKRSANLRTELIDDRSQA